MGFWHKLLYFSSFVFYPQTGFSQNARMTAVTALSGLVAEINTGAALILKQYPENSIWVF